MSNLFNELLTLAEQKKPTDARPSPGHFAALAQVTRYERKLEQTMGSSFYLRYEEACTALSSIEQSARFRAGFLSACELIFSMLTARP